MVIFKTSYVSAGLGLLSFRRGNLVFLLTLMAMNSGCTWTTGLYFYPQEVWIRTPAAFDLDYQDVWLTAHDGTELHAWWIPAQASSSDSESAKEPPEVNVLYLHGNAENISSHIASVAWLPKSGVGMLALDYRGFGASTGRALVPDVFQDIEAAAIWIRQQFPESRFMILGQSIGASLSVPFVAKAQYQYQIDGLVLEAPFAGFGSVARDMLTQNWIGTLVWPFTWLVPDEWDPKNWAGQIRVPVLQIHSQDDQVVSIEQGRRLFERFENSALHAESISEPGLSQIESPQWIEARGPHIAAFADPSIRAQVLSFVKRID